MNRLLRLSALVIVLLICLVGFQRDFRRSEAPPIQQTVEADATGQAITNAAAAGNEIASDTRLQSDADNHTHDFAYIENALRRDHSILEPDKMADGSNYANLRGTYRSASMARRLPDGSLEVVCFENFGAAKDFLLHPAKGADNAHICDQCALAAEQ